MKPKAQQAGHAGYEVEAQQNGTLCVRFMSAVDVSMMAQLYRSVLPQVVKRRSPELMFDMRRVPYLDDFSLTTLLEFKHAVEKHNGRFRLVHAGDNIRETLFTAEKRLSGECALSRPASSINVFVRFGGSVLRELDNLRYMVSFIGSVCMALLRIVLRPQSLRWDDTISAMEQTGVDAVPIVGMISFLMGLIIAFMSSLQLRQFGADLYVASLVALAMVSELGPIMTAIIVAGRSGSAFAAEIGSMRISEEIDALFVMGFNPTLFLAAPRVIASVIVVPLLTLFANFFAIAGGLVVGVFMLNLTPGSYISQTLESIGLFDVMWGLLKAVVFALLIAWTGCLRGFQVRGGAASVGSAATSAVVTSIFFIILFDSIFAVIRSYW